MNGSGPHSFPVNCAHCKLPIAEIQGDTLVIISRHYGDKHVTVLPLDYFRAILPDPLDKPKIPVHTGV